MPELPEVETIVSDLRPALVGLRFLSIQTTHKNALVPEEEAFSVLEDKKVLKVERRGKYIRIFFEEGVVMTIHLRMSGRLIIRNYDDEPLNFERTRIDFDGASLRFCDMRKFGKVWVSRTDNLEEVTGTHKLGIEPLSKEFSFEKFREIFSGRRGVIKKWLLDQSLIAGIGNIYADEACFYAGVRPDRDVAKLTDNELRRLYEGILVALKQGIENRGTSISDFEDAFGKSGGNQELLFVYGRGGYKCLKCNNQLEKIKLAGRGTVFCLHCQQ